MIKYFCDRCGKECGKGARTIERFAYDGLGIKIVWIRNDHLCKECDEKFMSIHDKLKNEDDIFDMTDEEIELLRYTFKVGDKVITSGGCTGIITSICDCYECKMRGFHDMIVDFGGYRSLIRGSDKENGFKSYYQIGDIVFGNLDEESVCKELDEITERQRQLILQFATIRNLKGYKENNYEI